MSAHALLLAATAALFVVAGCAGAASTPTPTRTAPTPTPTAGPLPGSCDEYTTLVVEAGAGSALAVATSWAGMACGVVDFAQGPGVEPGLAVAPGTPLRLAFSSPGDPQGLELRLYDVPGLSGAFGRWPDELPAGSSGEVRPVDTVRPAPARTLVYVADVGPGDYTLVVRASWEAVDVFFAIVLRVS